MLRKSGVSENEEQIARKRSRGASWACRLFVQASLGFCECSAQCES